MTKTTHLAICLLDFLIQIKNMTNFIKQFLLHPNTTGAIAPSSRYLARKIVESVDFNNANLIIEYGPGTGSFTKELLLRKKPETVLVLIEQNDKFYQKTKELFDGKNNTTVLHGSAEKADDYIKKLGFIHADVVICGLPFTSLPETVSISIFNATRNIIGNNGTFITFQYTTLKKKMFLHYFRITDCLLEWINFPPAFIFVMKCI